METFSYYCPETDSTHDVSATARSASPPSRARASCRRGARAGPSVNGEDIVAEDPTVEAASNCTVVESLEQLGDGV